MNENNTVIKLDNVSKRFNVYSRNIDRIKSVLLNREPAEVKNALKDISLEIKQGERVVVFGVVDSGRTTLTKVISGVTFPSKGKVQVSGTQNVMLDPKAGMDMEFSCRDNIFMKANIVGLKQKEIEPHVESILEFSETKDFEALPMKRATKGVFAPMSLAVHLVYDADLLIMDEVFKGGGNLITSKCEERITKYLADNPEKTAFIVTNRTSFAKKVGTRAIVLDKGEIIFDGDIAEAGALYKEKNTGKKAKKKQVEETDIEEIEGDIE